MVGHAYLSTGGDDAGGNPNRDPNAALRAELRALWSNRVPPHLTTGVARREFDHFLTRYPHALPEIIAVELIRRADQWDEITAVLSVLSGVLTSSTPRAKTTSKDATDGPVAHR